MNWDGSPPTLRPEQAAKRSLRSACRDTLRPLVQLPARQSWGADGVHFLSRLVSEDDADIAAMVNAMYAPFWQRLDRALAEQLPEAAGASTTPAADVHEHQRVPRRGGGRLAHAHPLGDLSHFDEDTLLDHLVDYLIGGLQAPCLAAT